MVDVNTPGQAPEPAPEPTMSLLDHVRELRDRLFRIAIAVVIGAVAGYYFRAELLELLKQPAPEGVRLITLGVPDQLTIAATIAITVGAIIGLPVILWQVLGFVAPGLYPHEKRWLFFAIPFGLILFIAGGTFAFKVMLPTMIPFLLGIFGKAVDTSLSLDQYITFVSGVLFWMGVAFEMPVIMFVLAKLNVINARVLLKYWRYAIVAIAVIAAVITPTPDPVNMGIVMVPLIVLYGFSIVMTAIARRGAQVPALLDPSEKDQG